MTPATTPSSSTKKPQQVPKKASRRLSSASSYLNNLSAAPSASINKKNEPERTKEKKQSIGKDGKGTSYLESLSSAAAPASSSDSKKTKEEKVKSKQSTETSKNPYLEEVRGRYFGISFVADLFCCKNGDGTIFLYHLFSVSRNY